MYASINQSIQGMKIYEDSDIKVNYPLDWEAHAIS